MEEKILQCVLTSAMLGFEPAKSTNLAVKLENITCDGGTAMRDAILRGTNMMIKMRQMHIEMELPNLWQFVHIVITDGEDNASKDITKQGLQNLMGKIGSLIPPQLLKTIYIGVDLDNNQNAREELEELAEIGGQGAELKCITAGEMDQIFKKIIFQLRERVQIQAGMIQKDNMQMAFLQGRRTPELHIMIQRYLILFTLDVSGSMEGQRWSKVTKAVRQILGSLGNDDMVYGIVFNNNCHIVRTLNTQQWNKEIYDRKQQEAAKKKAEEEAKLRAQQQQQQQQQYQQQQQQQQLQQQKLQQLQQLQQQRNALIGLMLLSGQPDSDSDDDTNSKPSSIQYQTNRNASQAETCMIQ